MAEEKKLKRRISFPTVIVVLVAAFFVVKGIMQQPKISENNDKIEKLTEKITQQEKKLQDIEELKTKVDTDEYIEKVAREKLGLIKENEIVFIDVAGE